MLNVLCTKTIEQARMELLEETEFAIIKRGMKQLNRDLKKKVKEEKFKIKREKMRKKQLIKN